VSADFNVSLFIQTSPGAFATPIALYPGGANWVAVGDLNGDGAQDVALTDAVGVKVLLHTGAVSATTFAAPVIVFTQTVNADVIGANVIAIADVNGDGFNDLVITDPGPTGGAAPTVSVLLQDAAHPGQFLPAVSYPTAPGSLAQSIVVTDINGDGHPDIVIGGTNAVTVLLQNASSPGTFMAAANYAVMNSNQIAIADVNGDGHLDIIVATGLSHTIINGVITNTPGVLLQNAASPGTFGALQDLP
jgi:FG-GAP-like repeat/FG-GAP repeat